MTVEPAPGVHGLVTAEDFAGRRVQQKLGAVEPQRQPVFGLAGLVHGRLHTVGCYNCNYKMGGAEGGGVVSKSLSASSRRFNLSACKASLRFGRRRVF